MLNFLSINEINAPERDFFYKKQAKQLLYLLKKAKKTAFGKHYAFKELLQQPDIVAAFQQNVAIHTYETMYQQWWRISLMDEPDVAWPGIIPYYALSSGTSEASSKYIPVTEAMLNKMKKATRKMLLDSRNFGLSKETYTKKMLMVGSCTSLQRQGGHFIGDLSGIVGQNRPFWMEHFYAPGKNITQLPEWKQRIEAIVASAHKWDIGFCVGNPAWVQIVFEKIIEHYNIRNIHEIWPNLKMYAHGGVFFEPYRATFEGLLEQKIEYMDSYLASEGFIAYQKIPQSGLLNLLVNCGIFYEFIPFNAENFDENGDLRPHINTPKTVQNIENGVQYALLMTTCAGAWRYLIGDTVEFTDVDTLQFRITGRTKQFLSVCGEHLSIDNLNEAVKKANIEINAQIREFSVAAVRNCDSWGHIWYISTDNVHISQTTLAEFLDKSLEKLNDDYAVERKYALQNVEVQIIPNDLFFQWLKSKGKMNGQAKIPRILKGEALNSWSTFLNTVKI